MKLPDDEQGGLFGERKGPPAGSYLYSLANKSDTGNPYWIGPRFQLPFSEETLWKKNQICKRCTQHIQLYRRNLGAPLAKFLIWLYQHTGEHYTNSPTPNRGGDHAKLQHWRLISLLPKDEDSQQKSSGKWEITDRGRRYCEGAMQVPKYVLLYDNRLWDYELPLINIWDSLELKRFEYENLMRGEGGYTF